MPVRNDLWSLGKCGLKLIQYASAGLPSLSHPIGDFTEIIEDGESGFLRRDLEGWKEALERLRLDVALSGPWGRRRGPLQRKSTLSSLGTPRGRPGERPVKKSKQNGVAWFLDDEALVPLVEGLSEGFGAKRTHEIRSAHGRDVFVKYFVEKGFLGMVRNWVFPRGKREYAVGRRLSSLSIPAPFPRLRTGEERLFYPAGAHRGNPLPVGLRQRSRSGAIGRRPGRPSRSLGRNGSGTMISISRTSWSTTMGSISSISTRRR